MKKVLQPAIRFGQRPYSIRTRIKTYLLRFLMRRRRGQRPYSIRTRIKTTPWLRCLTTSRRVRDHIPLEQGLRQSTKPNHRPINWCQRPYSIRTRIKTPQILTWEPALRRVRDHIPLEQGLRRRLSALILWERFCQRPYSIRTRIKTCPIQMRFSVGVSQRPYSIRTRIKTPPPPAPPPPLACVRDHIPLEQGLRPLFNDSPSLNVMSETIFH